MTPLLREPRPRPALTRLFLLWVAARTAPSAASARFDTPLRLRPYSADFTMADERISDNTPRPHENLREWFERVVGTHYNLFFATAYTILGDKQEAEDAVQTGVLKAFQKLSTLDEARAIVAWLKTIVQRTALDLVRARRPDQSTSDPADFGGLAAPDANNAIDDDLMQLLLQCIEELPESQSDVVKLRVVYEQDIADIAEGLGVTANAARVRLFRGLERLRADPRLRKAFGWEDE
ncbi:MAG: sigma-70 family RNA polymerase sigma factor [Planctomycetota bacterium]